MHIDSKRIREKKFMDAFNKVWHCNCGTMHSTARTIIDNMVNENLITLEQKREFWKVAYGNFKTDQERANDIAMRTLKTGEKTNNRKERMLNWWNSLQK